MQLVEAKCDSGSVSSLGERGGRRRNKEEVWTVEEAVKCRK